MNKKNITKNLFRITVVIIITTLAVIGASVLRNRMGRDTNESVLPPELPAIYPSEAMAVPNANVRLYFRFKNTPFLAAQTREIVMRSGERLETAVLNELLKGPATGSPELETTLHPLTRVLNVEENGDTLFITLNAAYLNKTNAPTSDRERNAALQSEDALKTRLSTCAIINTLTGLGDYARVQILLANSESEAGSRVSLGNMGFLDTDDPTLPLEPMGYVDDIVLDAPNTASVLLRALIDKDMETVLDFVSTREKSGAQSPEKLTALMEGELSMQWFEITGETLSADGKTAVVRADVDWIAHDGSVLERVSVPVRLSAQSEIWKIAYGDLEKIIKYNSETAQSGSENNEAEQ